MANTPTENDDILTGTGGDDVIDGLGGNDVIRGNGGLDDLRGGAGNDVLDGGSGDDQLRGGDDNDYLRGGPGDDLIDGGVGFDRVAYSNAPSAVTVDLRIQNFSAQDTGGAGHDTIINIDNVSGSFFSDTLYGNDNPNWIWALGPTDGITPTNDNLYGNGGDDLLQAGTGDHILDGGSGIDTVGFGQPGDILFAIPDEAGNNGIIVNLGIQGVAQDTHQGMMTLTSIENVSGSVLDDVLSGSSAANVIAGDAGNDFLNGFGGNDTIYGDGAIGVDSGDTGTSGPITTFTADQGTNVDFYDAAGQLVFLFAGQPLYDAAGHLLAADVSADPNDPYTHYVIGGVDYFFYVGSSTTSDGVVGNDVIDGGTGDDTLYGGGGNDLLRGGVGPMSGNDLLDGGDGDDYLTGGAGNDTITGGAGIDRAGYFTNAGGAGVTVDLRIVGTAQDTGSQGMDTLSGIENVSGTTFADTLTGDGGDNWLWGSTANYLGIFSSTNNDTISGMGGNDLIVVGIGNHMLDGGADNDTLRFTENGQIAENGITVSLALQGSAQTTGYGDWNLSNFENLSGGQGGDHLTGDGGDNRLTGEGGDDTLVGGGGDDILSGDAVYDADTHGLGYSGAARLIYDPDAAPGNDHIDGGTGDDTALFLLAPGPGSLTLGHDGDDLLILRGSETIARVSFSGTTVTVQGLNSGAQLGTDTLVNIDHLNFQVDGGGAPLFVDLSVGVVVDGYVAGGTVFADANNNGVLDSGEVSAITDANGNFNLVNGTGPLVVFGGTNVDTGLPNLVTLTAPEGSSVVNPLTTLVQILVDGGSTVAAAQDKVASAFGIDTNVDLTSYDPLAHPGDPAALDIQQASAAVVVLVLAGADAAGGGNANENAVFDALAAAMTGGIVDLTNTGTVTAILTQALPGGTDVTGATQATTNAATAFNAATDFVQVADAQEAALNNPPVNTVGGTATMNEDANAVALTGISVADDDAGSGNLTVTLSVQHGTLAIATGVGGGIDGSQITGGANGSATITITATVSEINATLAAASGLTYTPTPQYHGADALHMVTSDNGHSGAGGAQTDTDDKVIAITSVNDAPHGTDATLAIPPDYALRLADFGYGDTDGNALLAVKIATLPGAGTLYLDSNGDLGGGPVAVAAGQSISAADIAAGHLTFVAPRDTSGNGYASFTFQVQDDGGTGAGGVDLDASPNTLTFNVLDVYDPPATYHATLDLAALGGAGFKLQGDAAFDYAGSSVSGAGDVNGDGFADFIVGAPLNTDTAARQGAAYVIFGHAGGFVPIDLTTPLTSTQGFKILGGAVDDRAGFSVSAAGDVNGDGFADIIVGANSNAGGGIGAGAAYVIFGHAGGFGTIDLATMTADEGFKIQGAAARDSVGFNVSAAGDVNGDGFADIIVSAVGSDSGGYNGGGAYVIFGHASGFGTIDLATPLTATQGFQIVGEAAGDVAGVSVSAAGDINGDGFADIIVGAQGNDSGGSFAGAAYVIFGHAGGFGTINLATLTAGEGFKIQGAGIEEYAGRSVSAAGDVNGDGIADIIVGANGNDGGGDRAGAAYVLFGHTGAFATIDLAAPLDASQGFKILGDADSDFAGYSVSAAGDFNGDGFADIIIGALGNDSGGDFAGAAYVIFGHASGFGTIDLGAGLTADQGFKIQGEAAGDALSDSSVSAAGDVNGDGFDDIIVGALKNDSGGDRAGAAYVIFGHTSAPTQHANAGLTLNEGATGTVTSAQLDYDDLEQGDSAITYTITSAATNGTLSLSGNALGVGDTFTQDDINHNLVTFHHDGSETTSANFGFSVSDGAGGDVTGQSFAFAINPVNDAPVNTVPADFAISSAEDTSFAITGMQTSDVDADPAAILTVNLLAEHGTLTVSGAVPGGAPYIDGNGTTLIVIAGTLSQINATLGDAAAVQFHGDADYNGTATITLVTSDGGSSGIDPGTTGDSTFEYDADEFSITITPVNDAPVIGKLGADSASFTEGDAFVRLDVDPAATVSDIDSTDFDGGTLTVSFGASGLAQDRFDIAHGDARVSRTAGSVMVDGFTIGSVDNDGPNQDFVITFNAQATPDRVAALLHAIAYFNSAGDDPSAGTRDITITLTDGDTGSTSVISHVEVDPVNDAAVLSADTRNLTETNSATDISSSGTLTISDVDSAQTFQDQTGTTGSYGSFSIDAGGHWIYTASSAHDEFVAGTTYTDTFSVLSADGTSTSVTIHIAGTNDAALLSADTRNLTETNSATDISSSGTLTISDVDSAQTFQDQTGTTGSYGSFSIDAGGHWIYTASSAHDEFVAGTTYTDTFSVLSADGTSTSVTIHIAGTNDAAVLSADTRNLTETNSATDISSSGTLTISDVDSAQTFIAQTGTSGAYGSFSIDSGGAWTYTASSAHDEFVAGTTYTDTFSVLSADGTSTSVTIHIAGTNDAAVLSADTRNLTETNSATDISSSGTLTISDVDSAQTFIAQTGTSGAYGSFSIDSGGAWTYTASSAHDEFVAGTTYTDTFSVLSADGTSTSVKIHIAGTNDAASITGDISGATDETDTPVTINGDLNATDVDSSAAFVAQSGASGNFGTFSIDTGGTWSYVANSAFDELAAGASHVDAFTVSTADGTTQVVTVTINGTNDAPLFSGTAANLTFTENGAAVQVVTSVSASDIDSGNYAGGTLSASVTTGVHAGDTLSLAQSSTHGSGIELSGNDVEYDGTIVGTLTASGSNLSIQLNASADDIVVQALTEAILISSSSDNPTSATRTVTISLADGGGTANGGQDTATFMRDVSFIAVNDAPSGTDHTITANENTPRALNPVDFAFTDLDNNGFAAVTITSLPTHGTIYYDQDGAGGSAFAPTPIIAGTTFTVADLVGAKLTYRPDPDETGDGYASFTYIVRDNGGTANGGQDTDPTANTITINVGGFNNSPTVTGLDNDVVTFFEDTPAGVVWLDNGRDAAITDIDSANFDAGSLLVHIVVNNVATEDEIDLITGTNGVTMTSTAVTVDVITFGVDPDTGDPTEIHTPTPGHTNEVFVDGVSIGTYTYVDGDVPKDFQLTLNSGATPESITQLIHNLSYVNTNTVAPDEHQRLIEFRLADGDGGTMTAFTTVSVVSVDDPATAGNDSATTNEVTPITFNVLGNDHDIDGPDPSVGKVNGVAISVNTPITLASGALLTLNADGTFTYDPHGHFDSVPAANSGASNLTGSDSFTYTLAGGGTATVTMTINGVDSNDVLLGTAGADTMSGGIGNDHINGLGGNDNLIGGTGNDVIDGGTGADFMDGGAGNDSFYVDTAGDYIIEAANGGSDRVYASADYTLYTGQSVETLSTDNDAGTAPIALGGNELDNIIYGNAGDNILYGKGGNDFLAGLGGNDSYFIDSAGDYVQEAVGGGSDRIYAGADYTLYTGQSIEILATDNNAGTAPIALGGNELDNIIYGNAGDNILYGKGGNDFLGGLGGNDSYFVDSAGDYVQEFAGGGSDRIYASADYTLYTGQSIEILSTDNNFGTAPIALGGNELDNIIYGNAGDNVLYGKGGNDFLGGLAGNDSYFVDSAGDYVQEAAGGGNDRIYASGDYTLYTGQSIEILSTDNNAGTASIALGGNELDNIIFGNDGNNILYGKEGNDTLLGLGGNDQFWFNTALGATNVDSIYGFTSGSDKLILFSSIFTGLAAGALGPGVFGVGTVATDEDQRIVYDQTTGNLYYDADGTGAIAGVLFATLHGAPALTSTDIQVF